jgi:uncharacterized membrane protein YeaQ/YmgE (transglycosylase-associated protein family)
VHLLRLLIVGAVAGWLAGLLMKGRRFGVFGNIAVGVVGAVLGGYPPGAVGVYVGGRTLGTLATALIGAIVLLFVVGLLKRA